MKLPILLTQQHMTGRYMAMAENIVKKTLDFGLGLALYSKEKVEALVEEMVNKGEVARKDARQLADDLVKKGEAERDEIRKMVSDEVKSALKTLGLAKDDESISKSELERIVHEQVEAALAKKASEAKAKKSEEPKKD